MKKLLFTTFTFFLFTLFSFAQTPPQGINYQAIARDTAGKAISSSMDLAVKFTVWSASSGGISLFSETHSPVNTNSYGLFTLVIGSVNTTDFQNITWPLGDKFLEVEIATVGGNGYYSMGRTQLMSVPYALHSKTADFSYGNWSLYGNAVTDSSFIGTKNAKDWVLKTNNIERMRVKSAGNVGIGTATPNGRLDVKGNDSTSATYGFGVRNSANDYALIVRDDGHVGIGTTTPSALFSVGTNSQFQVNDTGTIAAATGITSTGAINFSGLSTNGIVRTTGGTGTLSSNGGQIDLSNEVIDTLPIINGGTGLGSLGNWQAFYSDGLGALTPFSLGTSGTVFQSNGNSLAPTWVTPSSLMQNLSNGTGISPFTYNGSATATINIANTGITPGTYNISMVGQTITIPTFTVNAQGQLTAENNSTVNVEAPLTFDNGLTRTLNNIQLGGTLIQNTTIAGGSFNTLFDLNSTGNFSINQNGGTSAFFVNPNGNVGIGTSSPVYKLDVQKGLSQLRILSTTTGKIASLITENDSGNAKCAVESNAGGVSITGSTPYSAIFGTDYQRSLHLATASTVRATIDKDGNFGIGTITPLSKLDVSGGIAIGTTYSGTAVAPTDGAIIEGSVGIGTASPATTLDVNGIINSATGYRIANGAVSGNYLRGDGSNFVSSAIQASDLPSSFSGLDDPSASVGLTAINGVATTAMRSDAAPALSEAIAPIWTSTHIFNNVTYSALFTGGNVGIGTSTPGAKLEVNGTVKITGGAPGAGKVLTSDGSGLASWTTPTTGTVTSVATGTGLTGGAITSSGTLSLDYSATLAANPALTSGQSVFGTTGLLFEGATANAFEGLLTPTDPTADRTWTLPDATGTIALSSQIPTGLALTKTDDANVTLTLGGTPATSLINATSLTLGWTGLLSIARGGTNGSALPTAGGVSYGTGSAFAFTGAGTSGQVLKSNGAGAPTWITPTAGTVTSVATGTGLTGGSITSTGTLSFDYSATIAANPALTSGQCVFGTTGLIFEGVTVDNNEGLLFTDPTADRTWKLPDASGTIALLSDISGNNWSITGNTGTSAATNFVGTTDNVSLRFRTYNTEKMIIDSLGKVGIGTTSPQSLLHIFESNSTAYSAITQATAQAAITNTDQTNTSFSRLLFNTNDAGGVLATGASLTALFTSHASNAVSADLIVQTKNAGTNAEVARFTSDGNVGIGTTAPATNARLAINDGHLQSQQTTAPSVVDVSVGYAGNFGLSPKATDMAGNINILPAATAGSVTFNFNMSYAFAPIVILTATNEASASDFAKIWVTTTLSSFTVNYNNVGGIFPPQAVAHKYSYHVIETQ